MDTEKLTFLLRKNGHLGKAIVTGIKLTPMETNGIASEFYMADLRYSSDDHSLPSRMVIKRPKGGDRGRNEADAYEYVLGRGTHLPIMNCYGILDEDPERPLSFLFEDLSSSHDQSPWPIIPRLSDCEGAVAALARVHAHWWGQVDSLDAFTPQVVAHQDVNHLATFFPKFVDFVGEYLSTVRIKHYERVFKSLNILLSHRLTSANTTLLHTDSHFWNFLYPKDGQQGECVIFDWPLWRTGLAGWDLAYMIGLHLYPEHRHRFEPVLLDRYWRVLNEEGVAYNWKDVQIDYRIGIIVGLLMPVMEFSWNIPPIDWMPKLEKAFTAFEDLNCDELIEAI